MEEGERRRGKGRSGYGSASEEDTKRRSKRGSTRSSDGGAINAGDQWREWIGDGSYDGARWCADRVNPTAPLSGPFYTH
jgi:hypothetical protein